MSWRGWQEAQDPAAEHLTGAGALGGAFWGLLFGLLFFVPLLGMAVGAAHRCPDRFDERRRHRRRLHQRVRDQVTPGTSALFVMTSDAVRTRSTRSDAGLHGELIRTNLSDEQEAKLRETFSE